MSGAWTNPDAHLPSSSRSTLDTSRSADGFDLNTPESAGAVARGSANGQAILGKRQPTTPAVHSVRQGDTLWDLCGGYFQNPWMWPKVWSYNPQIQNPHWIYPGDQVRLRIDAPPEQRDSIVLGAPKTGPQTAGGGGFVNRRPLVPRDTVFLRSGGYIDDPRKDVWGELV
ncbi:MAG: LysM peptidoglycan-binding domain-containing protein, partial [Deltaproteobacteria bacterium]|nr:LysM peptidoglycan-binding domain-containing protein [Deltaproteobacteria bacterium]